MRATQAQLDSQQHLVVSNDEVIGRTLKPKYVLGQVVFASIVFAISITFGGAFFMFFAGGFVVATALALGFNYHGLMYVRALHDDSKADGRLSLSVRFVFTNSGHQILGGALACLILGLILQSLALLGGALYLGATGVGYLRRAQSGGVRP